MTTASPLRFLIVESEPPEAREQRRETAGCTSGETYAATLRAIDPTCRCEEAKGAGHDRSVPHDTDLAAFDAVFLTGSPLHLYEETPDTRRQVDLMRAIFASGTPSFGSCAGLHVATVAAGGSVQPNARGREVAFARRVVATEAGRVHPLLAGRPPAFDAPAIHTDEVGELPPGATLLAGNAVTAVQAAEIRQGDGVFWGVQYHPELSLGEIAAALRRQSDGLVEEGFGDPGSIGRYADLVEELGQAPERRDLAWRLGIDEEITVPARRTREIANFIDHLVRPTRSSRLRG